MERLIAGRYAVDGRLPDRGPFEVWRALESASCRRVRVWWLSRADAGVARELAQAFDAQRGCAHPSLVPALDASVEEGRPLWVTPDVEGEPIAEVLAREGPLTVTRALRVLGPIADAIEHLHGRGLVHGAVDAEHVVLLRDGRAMLADLGVALVLRALVAREAGRPMERPGAAADQRALAALYEHLTGVGRATLAPSVPPPERLDPLAPAGGAVSPGQRVSVPVHRLSPTPSRVLSAADAALPTVEAELIALTGSIGRLADAVPPPLPAKDELPLAGPRLAEAVASAPPRRAAEPAPVARASLQLGDALPARPAWVSALLHARDAAGFVRRRVWRPVYSVVREKWGRGRR